MSSTPSHLLKAECDSSRQNISGEKGEGRGPLCELTSICYSDHDNDKQLPKSSQLHILTLVTKSWYQSSLETI
jgi:hypothetical protein